MRLSVNPGVVSISIASELVVATSAVLLLVPAILLELNVLGDILVLANLVLTVVVVASVVSFLVETELVPMLLGSVDGVGIALESIGQVLVSSEIALGLDVSDSWGTLGVSSLEVTIDIVVVSGILHWVSLKTISGDVELLATLFSFFGCLSHLFGAHCDRDE